MPLVLSIRMLTYSPRKCLLIMKSTIMRSKPTKMHIINTSVRKRSRRI
jgi:hypothetical protein